MDQSDLFLDQDFFSQKLKESDHLLAGPWIGEFGWELFCFQGYLRKLKDDNPHIKSFNVISRPGRSVIYVDFCDAFVEYYCPGTELTGALCMGWDTTPAIQFAHNVTNSLNLENCIWIPPQIFPINYHADGPEYEKYLKIFNESQKFIQFGKFNSEVSYDIVIHARSTGKFNSSDRNWPEAKWYELIELLNKDGLKMACIGLEGQALALPKTANLLNIPLDETVDVLSSSKCIVGTSSGPIHLASLCGCPQVLISECVESGGKDNERIYKYDWNPLKTPVHLVKYENSKKDNGWNPPINKVKELIDDILF